MPADSDIAEREHLQQFLQVVSHDLSAPLRQIVSFGEILQEEEHDRLSEDGRIYLRHMVAAGERMQAMLDGLLALARVASRGQAFEACALTDLAAREVEILAPAIKAAGAVIEIGDLPRILGDSAQLSTVFHELLGNALKYARPGVRPQIRVEANAAADRDWVRIDVRDNGIGFEGRDAERIFGVFQRLHGEDEYEGIGIGLALCRRICERHGGRISASGVPDGGAHVMLELPRGL